MTLSNHKESSGDIRPLVEQVANQLCEAVKGRFDFCVAVETHDETIEKLQMLANFLLDSARRSLAEVEGQNRKLIESETLIRSIVDTAADGIITINERGIIGSFNRAAERIFGYAAVEMIGKNVRMLMPSPYAEEHDGYLQRYLITGMKKIIGARCEVVGRRKDGSTFPMDLQASEVRIGEKQFFTGLVRDISSRKRAEEERARFSRVLESSLNELYFFDAETLRFVDVNLGARQNLGYSMQEFRNLTPLDLKPEFTAESFAELIEPLRTGVQEVIQFFTVHRRKDGSLYPVDVHLQLMAGSTPMFLAIVLDITELRRAEEDRLRRLEVEQERNHLRDAMNAQEHLLGVVGHELRTPLAGIRAISELLIDEGSRNMDEFDTFLQDIHDEAVRMSDMVNDLLEIARMHSGVAQWNWAEVSLQEACEAAVNSVRPLINQDKVDLNLEVHPAGLVMQGDKDGIRRLVLNLLNNACRNTPQGSIYVLATGTVRDGHAFVNLTVGDTGMGMTPEVAEKLGQAFALNSGVVGESHVKGSGLGLAICRGITAAHGGTFSVRSTQGHGSTFTAMLRADLEGPMATEQDTHIDCEVT